jgi:phage terminase large subunit-like protein
MSAWRDVFDSEPEFAERARTFLDAGVHKTIATLRRDGSPRISGTEATIADGELWFGAMWRSRKALDLRRDPRFALHSASLDPPAWEGDAKVSGHVEEIEDDERKTRVLADADDKPSGPWHLFFARIEEVAVIRLSEQRDRLVIEVWKDGEGLRRMER